MIIATIIMSACPVAATKKKTSVRTKETATFNVRRIKIVDRILARCLRMIVSLVVVNSIARIFRYVKVIKHSEIIAIEIANVLPTFAKKIYVIRLASRMRKITTLTLS